MENKIIPHTQNALTLTVTNKAGTSEYLAMSQKAATGEVDGVFLDAPKDGKMYARQNGKWVEIPTSTSSDTTVTD